MWGWGWYVCSRMENFSRQWGASYRLPMDGAFKINGSSCLSVQLGKRRPKEGCGLLRAKT